jgi:hypothetical protein
VKILFFVLFSCKSSLLDLYRSTLSDTYYKYFFSFCDLSFYFLKKYLKKNKGFWFTKKTKLVSLSSVSTLCLFQGHKTLICFIGFIFTIRSMIQFELIFVYRLDLAPFS